MDAGALGVEATCKYIDIHCSFLSYISGLPQGGNKFHFACIGTYLRYSITWLEPLTNALNKNTQHRSFIEQQMELYQSTQCFSNINQEVLRRDIELVEYMNDLIDAFPGSAEMDSRRRLGLYDPEEDDDSPDDEVRREALEEIRAQLDEALRRVQRKAEVLAEDL